MTRLRRWWTTRSHDRRDINCIHWYQPRNSLTAVCAPCQLTGGYVAARHREQDA